MLRGRALTVSESRCRSRTGRTPTNGGIIRDDLGSDSTPGALVRNWGLSRGDTGGTFIIDDIERSAIVVRGGKMVEPRLVSKGEFEKLYAVWDQYLAGSLPRSKMLPLSQNTTYILSILHLIGSQSA
jgi:hypothetical protein